MLIVTGNETDHTMVLRSVISVEGLVKLVITWPHEVVIPSSVMYAWFAC